LKRQTLQAWLLLSPALVGLAIFTIYPAFQSFYLSLHDVDPFTAARSWAGLANYGALASSADYWASLRTSLVFTLATVVPGLLLSLGIAVGLDQSPYFKGFFRTIFLLPVAISSAMAAMLWVFIYNPTAGYLNYLLSLLGVAGPNWLGDPTHALAAVAIATVWKELGFNIVFFLAGLNAIPGEIQEAATMDGATAWQRFWRVTMPLLSPTLFFVMVVSVINSLQSFGQIHILTGGGPAGATTTMVYGLYLEAFVNFRTGYASAQAVLLFLLIMIATAVQFRLAQRRVHYG